MMSSSPLLSSLVAGLVVAFVGIPIAVLIVEPAANRDALERENAQEVTPRYAIEEYVTTNPATPPPKRSTDFSLAGLETNMLVEDVTKHFPPEARRSVLPDLDQSGDTHYGWSWKGLVASATVEFSTRSVKSVRLQALEQPSVYVSLPRGLLLGKSTVAVS
jgi:hypothetical protein